MYCDKIALPHCQMAVYIPDLVADPAVRRPTIVIAPGGGYTHLSTREGEPIALTFAAMGMNAVVVRYRVAPAVFPAPMQDIASAVAAIRQNADNWHADPNQIALCGFSAGAHAAGLLGVHWQEAHWWQEMHLTSADVRPNALILSYPVITAGEFAHRGSFRSLTGTDDIGAHQPHSLENLVTPDTPPTFLWHTWTDGAVPVENTLLMAMALHKAGVPAEVHVFPRGGHGVALGNQVTNIPSEEARKIVPEVTVWPELAARFIRQIFTKS